MDPVTTKFVLDLLNTPITTILTELTRSAISSWNPPPTNEIVPSASRIQSENLVIRARELLDQPRKLDSSKSEESTAINKLKELAIIITGVEIYQDIITYRSKHNIILGTDSGYIDENLGKLVTLLGQLSGELSSHENKVDEMPVGEVRRCLLCLSLFPNYCVFNRNRVIELFVAHRFFANDRDDPTPKQLADRWLRVVEGSWDGNIVPHHFLIGSDVKERSQGWPELVSFGRNDGKNECICRFLVLDASEGTVERIPNEIILCSLVYLGRRGHTLDLKTRQFVLLRSLSLRNVKLKNEDHLRKMSLLRYLDLKHCDVRNCDWLEGLEELETLDLRHTYVEEVPNKCLRRLGNLQCLLLGYLPREGVTRLTGVKINPENLITKSMKTLRTVRRPVTLANLHEVADLSVTGLSTRDEMMRFWDAVSRLDHLTSLGVAAAKGCTVELQHCQKKLMQKLQRLKLDGEFISGSSSTSDRPQYSGLEKLPDFKSLVDLTLASSKPIIGIPALPDLLCLRLYGVQKEMTLKLHELQGFRKLKKLVIGDMKEVKTIKIDSNIFEGLATVKLCNLPKFQELLSIQSGLLFLRVRNPGEVRTEGCFQEVQSVKTVFLKGFQNNCNVDKKPNLKIYTYDFNKQCYFERHARNQNQVCLPC